MAIDFFIATLLLLCVIVNVLAICAFRITPSLQTRSNSFVINLLIVNVVSCLILATFLLINTHFIRELLATNSGYLLDDSAALTVEDQSRRYMLDIVAALGALSLALVVYDTHSAITDPLRYHSRLSTVKVGILIASVWIVGIFIGIGSYFRAMHNLAFTSMFCALIVAAPFCLICAMYWRIFREARENGLRMRQNGSSPLLQSALNLVSSGNSAPNNLPTRNWDAPHHTIETIMEKSPSFAEGLTLKIDRDGEDAQNNLATASSTTQLQDIAKVGAPQFKSLVNLSVSRNESLRQIFLFGIDGDTADALLADQMTPVAPTTESLLNKLNNLKLHSPEVRHVRSTPDLQSYVNPDGLTSKSNPGVDMKALEYHFRSVATSQTPPKNLGYMTSIRHRLSNASSLFKYREESRAARISILVVIMFLVSYIPYGLLMVYEGFISNDGLLSPYVQTVLSILVVVLANISSPIIFAYRNKRVRRAVKRLLGLETRELLPSSFYSHNAKRMHRQKTISAYKKNLVLKSGPGRKMQRLLLTYPLAKCEAERPVKLADVKVIPKEVQIRIQKGYENYLEGSEGKVSRVGGKRGSTTSTTSTIRCEDAELNGGDGKQNSLLDRFGFIRSQSRKGVSV